MKKEKNCKNPDHNELFISNNPKQDYCCTSCKNHHNYLLRLKKYPQLYQINKIYIENLKIIEEQYLNGIKSLSEHDLNLLGFDHDVKPLVIKTINDIKVYIFENYYIKYKNGQVLITKFRYK